MTIGVLVAAGLGAVASLFADVAAVGAAKWYDAQAPRAHILVPLRVHPPADGRLSKD